MTLHGSVRDDSPPVDLSYPSKGAECWARCSSFCTESFHSRNPSILKIGKADSSDTSPTPHGSVPVFLAASTQQISTVFQLLWAGVPGGLSWNVQVLVSRRVKPEVMVTAIQRLVWGRPHSHSRWPTWFLASWASVQGSWLPHGSEGVYFRQKPWLAAPPPPVALATLFDRHKSLR